MLNKLLQVLLLEKKGSIGGKNFSHVQHEADVVKLNLLAEHGGLAIDLGVYILPNITALFEILRNYECAITNENNEKINFGFVACNRNAQFPHIILEEYNRNYRPDEWVYNIGEYPKTLENPSDHKQNCLLGRYRSKQSQLFSNLRNECEIWNMAVDTQTGHPSFQS